MKFLILVIVVLWLGRFLYKKAKRKRAGVISEPPRAVPRQITLETVRQSRQVIENQASAANVIIGTGVIAALSLFFPWISIPSKEDIFGINTPILLAVLLWWYSSRMAFSGKRIVPFLGKFFAALSVLFGIAATLLTIKIRDASPSYGIAIYLIAACIHFEAVRKYTKLQPNIQNSLVKEPI